MLRYIARRILSTLPLILGLVTVVFVLVRLLPGDPTTLYLSPSVPPSIADELRIQFGLDKSILTQYLHWLWGAIRGEFGFSFSHQQDVWVVIMSALPNTVALAIAAVAVEVFFGILIGLLAVRFHSRLLDKLITLGGLVVYSFPTFWIGILLLSVFSYWLGILPPSQAHSFDAESFGSAEYVFDFLKHLVLPAFTIGLPGAAGVARFLRTNLVSVLNEEYITVARSMGVGESRIFMTYALPNALIPIISIVGLELGTLLAGALITETIFAWPGMGRLTVMAIFARDYPLIIGCTLVSGFLVVFGNLLADVTYTVADPRIRMEVK